MLFLINKTQPNTFDLIRILGGSETKFALLIGDGIYYGTVFMSQKLKDLGVERIYVDKTGLQTRNLELAPHCQVITDDETVILIMEGGQKVISI